MTKIATLLLSSVSCLSAFGQSTTVDSTEEAEIKAAWDRVVQALGGEWKFPVYLYLYSENLDLRKPEIQPKGKEQEWTTIEDHEGKRRFLSFISTHDGNGAETWIRYNADKTEDGRGTHHFDPEGVYVSDYGDFITRKAFNPNGWLVEERDLDEALPTQVRYFYEEEKLVRIESRDPDEVQVEELRYDDRQRLSEIITHLGDGKEVMSRTFSYDDLDRLIRSERTQEGVILAWDKHRYSKDGRTETITHKWISRKTGQLGGTDISTREYDPKGTLRTEVSKSYGPGKPGVLREQVEREYDDNGLLFRLKTKTKGEPKRIETFERIWVEG